MPKQYEYSGWDAYGVLFSSFMYLITHPKYGIVLYFILGTGITREIINMTGISVKIGDQLQVVDIPKKPTSWNLVPDNGSIFRTVQDKKMSNTYESPDAIRVESKFLGFYDMRFQLWKEKGSDRIIVYSFEAKGARPWEVSGGMFDVDNYRQAKK